MSTPHLSLVMPVHRGEAFIGESIASTVETLERADIDFELVIVSDGSQDETPARVRAVADPRVRLLTYNVNQGKGFALCAGIAVSHGTLIGWLDADLDLHPQAIVDAVRVLGAENLDAVVGSKRHPASRVAYPPSRRILSWGFQRLVRLALRVDVRDTQVGAKVFRREMLETVVPLLLVKRYAFDLEVLAVGALFGFDRVGEIPVRLEYRFAGTGINSKAAQRMFVDTLAITYRVRLRHWYVRQFAALHRARVGANRPAIRDLPTVPASNLGRFREVIGPDWPDEVGEPVKF